MLCCCQEFETTAFGYVQFIIFLAQERTTLPNKYLLFRVFSTRRLADSTMPSTFIRSSKVENEVAQITLWR